MTAPTFPAVKAAINDARDRVPDNTYKIVLNELMLASGPLTQRHLAHAVATPGSRVYDKLEDASDAQVRQVRRIIRELRVTFGIPILSDTGGYWLPATPQDVDDAVARLEKTAKATAAAWFTTYKSIRKFSTKQSSYLELFVKASNDHDHD